jgi:hypothetical protein
MKSQVNMSNKTIRARITLPNMPTFALDIPLRSGNEGFGLLAAFIAHIEGVECPVRQAYRAMAMDDAAPTLTTAHRKHG